MGEKMDGTTTTLAYFLSVVLKLFLELLGVVFGSIVEDLAFGGGY